MVLFWPIQQELNCINDSGSILGKIKFDESNGQYIFCLDNESAALSSSEESSISQKVFALNSGEYSIPAQDDD
mgnify:CR=1 FL=1